MTVSSLPLPKYLKRILFAFARSLYGSTANSEPVCTRTLDDYLDAQWRATPTPLKGALAFITLVIFWSTFFKHFKTFHRLTAKQQTEWLRFWNHHPWVAFRLPTKLVFTFTKPAYYLQGDVKASLGYARPIETREIVSPPAGALMPIEQLLETPKASVRHQILVIGTGAGGSVIGAELAKQGLDVAFIEAGALHDAESFRATPLETLRKTYLAGGLNIAYGRPSIPIPMGQTVGGSTTVNSGTCMRIPDYVNEKLNGLDINLNHATLNEHYHFVENRINVTTVPPELLGGSSRIVAEGAERLGLNHGPLPRNIRGCLQSAQCAFGCPTGAKQSMHMTFLPDAIASGARIYQNTRAVRLKTHGNTVVGAIVQPTHGGPKTEIMADHVIVAGGSVGSVVLLKKSGISSRHLGKHLSIHPATKITALMPDDVNGWKDTPQGYGIFELLEKGILFEGAYVPPEYGVLGVPFVGDELARIMNAYRRLAIFGLFVADEPSGRVTVLPNGRPLVQYWLSQNDANKFGHGLSMLADVFFGAGAEEIFLPIFGQEAHTSFASANRILNHRVSPWSLELVAFHPLGTARMSARRKEGVIKPDGRIWGWSGVSVCDGSIFPTSLGVNPQLTIMATARHLAHQLF